MLGMTSPSSPEIKHLGLADYDSTFAAMRAFPEARPPDTRDSAACAVTQNDKPARTASHLNLLNAA